MAHKKAGGSTKNGRDSESKRLGLKKFGGEQVLAGNILVRQRGTVYRAGDNVGTGTDYTLFAKATGRVQFRKKGVEQHTFVSVVRRVKVRAILHGIKSPGPSGAFFIQHVISLKAHAIRRRSNH